MEFHAKRGDVLIWTSNIVHGGGPVHDEAWTRWSQVTHYYFDNSVYYTPVFSDFVSGELLLKHIIDLNTKEVVPHRYNGQPVTVTPLPTGRSRIGFESAAAVVAEPGSVPALQAHIAHIEGRLADQARRALRR